MLRIKRKAKLLIRLSILTTLLLVFVQGFAQSFFNADSTEKEMMKFYVAGSYEHAKPLSFQLLLYYQKTENSLKETELLNTIGEMYRASNNYDLSIKYLNRGLIRAKNNQDSLQISRAYNRLSAVYFEKSNLEFAALYADSSDAIANSKPILIHQISNLNLRGAISRLNKNYSSSFGYLQKALELAQENNSLDNVLSAELNIAQLYLVTKKYDEALEHSNKAIAMATENGHTSHLPYAYRIVARSYYSLGDYKKAYDFQSLHYELDSESRNKNTKQRIDLLNASLDTEKKVRENAELKQELANERNKWVLSGLIFIFILALFLFFLLRSQYKNAKILERKQQEIHKQNKELEELAKSKDQLFSILSHDLISPINFLAETLTLVTDEDLSVDEAKPVLKKLQVQTFHIRELTENVLTWARSQMGGSYVNIETANIIAPISASIRHVSAIAEQKGIKINFSDSDKIILANIDLEVVRFVTRNLLMNAIKFTNPNKNIFVSVDVNEKYAIAIFKDEGLGIPKEKIETLFNFKAERSYGTGKELGTGLGLPMCKDLIEKSGGKIELESNLGQGSIFKCYYPKV